MIPVKSFGREYFRNFHEAIRREWVITNGIGGYAGSSVIGANTRKHHGLLIASCHAPTDRRVILTRIDEAVTVKSKTVSLSSVQRKNARYENGYLYQTDFSYDAIPTFTYLVNGMIIKKTVAYEWEKNTVAILYEVDNKGDDAVLSFAPVFNYRDHNAGSSKRDLKFSESVNGNIIELRPKKDKKRLISFVISDGSVFRNDKSELFDEKIELQTEIDTGMSSSDVGYKPYRIETGIKANEKKKLSFVCSIEESFESNAEITIEKARKRGEMLIETAGFDDEFLKTLTISADNFITYRASTEGKTILAGLPWFTDWGRDTMIALTGLTLKTKRFEDARSILKTFSLYEKNGLIPNMFPDKGEEPLYNTVDASLWYFYCIYMYLLHVNNEEAYEFVKNEIYPCLKNIEKAYENGTDFSIKMDKDGLIFAGSDLDQVTWMDVRVDGYVVTPRHGKPVEINALWYNALMVLADLAKRFNEEDYATHLNEVAALTKKSFNERFWNEDAECLYDVVDEVLRDNKSVKDNESIRPNQIYAVSLPYTMLDKNKEKAIVHTVLTKLYVDYGLRTLPEDDPDYHGIYFGKLKDRDMAYHQGTAWAFPLGGLISAYIKVNDYSGESKEFAKELLQPMKHHINDGCIGGIAEIFDGDAPHISRGCYSQAWSVGEILRAYAELV